MDTHTVIQQQNQKLQDILVQNGFTVEQIQNILHYLDDRFTQEISENKVAELSEEEQNHLEKLQNDNASTESILGFLHLTEDEFNNRYAKKLEEYVMNLSDNIPLLKQQFSA